MFKLLIMIQLGQHSHSSQLAEYDTKEQADEAFKIIKNSNLVYNFSIIRLY